MNRRRGLKLAGLVAVPFLTLKKLGSRKEMLLVGTWLPPPRLSPTSRPEASVRLPVSTHRLIPGSPSGLGLASMPLGRAEALVPASMGAEANTAFRVLIVSQVGAFPGIESISRNRSLWFHWAPHVFRGKATPLLRSA